MYSSTEDVTDRYAREINDMRRTRGGNRVQRHGTFQKNKQRTRTRKRGGSWSSFFSPINFVRKYRDRQKDQNHFPGYTRAQRHQKRKKKREVNEAMSYLNKYNLRAQKMEMRDEN
jgi:hypothetical protein